MTDAEILHEVTDIVRDVLGDDAIVLGPGTRAEDVEGWDSFAHINIIVATEARFGMKFQTAELEHLHDVGHLVALVGRKLARRPT